MCRFNAVRVASSPNPQAVMFDVLLIQFYLSWSGGCAGTAPVHCTYSITFQYEELCSHESKENFIQFVKNYADQVDEKFPWISDFLKKVFGGRRNCSFTFPYLLDISVKLQAQMS